MSWLAVEAVKGSTSITASSGNIKRFWLLSAGGSIYAFMILVLLVLVAVGAIWQLAGRPTLAGASGVGADGQRLAGLVVEDVAPISVPQFVLTDTGQILITPAGSSSAVVVPTGGSNPVTQPGVPVPGNPILLEIDTGLIQLPESLPLPQLPESLPLPNLELPLQIGRAHV